MKLKEKNQLRLKVIDMFKHGFDSYMKYAYPADELMPLSCKGRFRDSEASRGDIDDVLGNFSLTLVDSLDSLAVFGMFDDFEKAIRLIIRYVTFDRNVIVSVFETNIRVLGGLLGGHICAKYIQLNYPSRLVWYSDELLVLAHDLGQRLLPAFNTTTGLPLPRVNLRYGIDSNLLNNERQRYTCTACAGTLILEFATLSRLTGNSLFEKYAERAMSYLWEKRNRQTNLMGTVLNVDSGEWIVPESGIGAGIDSYYEYLFKAYVLLGERNVNYLSRFETHYSSIVSYVQNGIAMLNVHMNQPYRLAKTYMDSLVAFWPGLQVLIGDLKPAIELHEMFYKIVKRYKFLPEAFTTDYRIYWKYHLLRPEFIESTYFLYKATNDPHYLEVGRTIIENFEMYARVPCGYAALSDVLTRKKEDRMDSFVLAETFKYLYLLFDSTSNPYIDVDQFLFTTEGHLLPLNFFSFNINNTLKNHFKQKNTFNFQMNNISKSNENVSNIRQCSILIEQYQSHEYKNKLRETIRQNQDMTTIITPSKITNKSSNRLTAREFSIDNPQHLFQLEKMGIHIESLPNAQIQLTHIPSSAYSSYDAKCGSIFIEEMIEIMNNSRANHLPLTVIPLIENPIDLTVASAQFGKYLHQNLGIFGQLKFVESSNGCSRILFSENIYSHVGIIRRGACTFIEKARNLEYAQAIAGIVIDDNMTLKSYESSQFSMSSDGNNNVKIPLVLMFKDESQKLLNILSKHINLIIYIGDKNYLHQSFYHYMDYLENIFRIQTEKWFYGQGKYYDKFKQCFVLSNQLKQLESFIKQHVR